MDLLQPSDDRNARARARMPATGEWVAPGRMTPDAAGAHALGADARAGTISPRLHSASCRPRLRSVDTYRSLGLSAGLYACLRWLICPFDRVERAVPKSGTVIDLGCGYGVFARLMAGAAPERRVIGVDLVPRRVEHAQGTTGPFRNLSFTCADIVQWPFPPADGITAIDVIHHIADAGAQQALLCGCYAALSAGGTLVVKDVDTHPRWKYRWNYLHDYLMTKGEPTLYRSRGEMASLIQKAGFHLQTIEAMRGYPYAHVLYVARKPAD